MKTTSFYQHTKEEPLLYLTKKTISKSDKEDYIKKGNEHFTSGSYTKLKKDPTSSIASKVTKKLIELRDNNLIEQQKYLKLKPTGKQPPRLELRPT